VISVERDGQHQRCSFRLPIALIEYNCNKRTTRPRQIIFTAHLEDTRANIERRATVDRGDEDFPYPKPTSERRETVTRCFEKRKFARPRRMKRLPF
jgi:hypothetical protein